MVSAQLSVRSCNSSGGKYGTTLVCRVGSLRWFIASYCTVLTQWHSSILYLVLPSSSACLVVVATALTTSYTVTVPRPPPMLPASSIRPGSRDPPCQTAAVPQTIVTPGLLYVPLPRTIRQSPMIPH